MCFTERNASKFKSIGEFDVIFKIHFLIKFLLIEHADFPVKDACKVFLGGVEEIHRGVEKYVNWAEYLINPHNTLTSH